jgi:hypothetical protein
MSDMLIEAAAEKRWTLSANRIGADKRRGLKPVRHREL